MRAGGEKEESGLTDGALTAGSARRLLRCLGRGAGSSEQTQPRARVAVRSQMEGCHWLTLVNQENLLEAMTSSGKGAAVL